MTRQNYYKKRKQRKLRAVNTEFIIDSVHAVRSEHPRMGDASYWLCWMKN